MIYYMFYKVLQEDKRQALFTVMRDLDVQETSYRSMGQKLAPPYGTISVGGGSFEWILKAECILSYLRVLRNGGTPEEAVKAAEDDRTLCVQKWNTSTGKDYVVHRSLESEQSLIEDIHRKVLRATE